MHIVIYLFKAKETIKWFYYYGFFLYPNEEQSCLVYTVFYYKTGLSSSNILELFIQTEWNIIICNQFHIKYKLEIK